MKIGVSGASGNLGAAVLRDLKLHGAEDVVGISRTPGSVRGCEARYGNYDEPSSLSDAYVGIDRLLIIPSTDLRPGVRARQGVAAVEEAAKAGVGRVCFLSSLGAAPAPEPDVRASYHATEKALQAYSGSWSILRMAYYIESLIPEVAQMLPAGMLTGLAETPVNFVSREDIAGASAGLLTSEGHDGKIYHLSGPRAYSGPDRAKAVSDVIGKPFAFVVLKAAEMKAGLESAGLPADVVTTVLSIHEAFARGDFDVTTDDVERLSGQAPQSLEDALVKAFGA